jgi:hypothetical protein
MYTIMEAFDLGAAVKTFASKKTAMHIVRAS